MSETSITPRRGRLIRWWRRHRAEALLAAVVLLVAAPVLQPLMAQQASRYALTAAVVDEATIRVDAHEHLLGVDRAERDGHVYSDKAPGQPLLAVPAYALYRLAGGSPAADATRPWADLGLWTVTAWSAALPAALLAVAMRRLALRAVPDRPRAAGGAALALALGTLLLPFATQLFGHVLAALLGLVAWLAATDPRGGRSRALAAGALAGLAVTVEYPMALVAALVVAGAAASVRGDLGAGLRRAGLVVAGGVPFGLALAAYHTVAFGAPLAFPYELGQFPQHQEGLVGAGLPRAATTAAVLVGERGLVTLTPVVLAGVVGLGALAVRRGRWTPTRRDAVAGLLVLAAFVALQGGWHNPLGGASPGPRYVTPALPWLAGGVAVALASRWRVVAVAAALAGGAAMLLATLTLPLAQPTEPWALAWWAARAADGGWADTLLTRATGSPLALAVPPLLGAGAALAWWRADGRAAAGAAASPSEVSPAARS